MNRVRVSAATLLAAVVLSGVADARDAAGGLTAVSAITNAGGDSRILFRATGLNLPDDRLAIRRALLRFSLQGEAVARRSEIRIYPVTGDWDAATVDWTNAWQEPGGDFDRELYARKELEFSRGSHTVAIDVTTLIKEIYEEGVEDHGFIVSVAPFEGEGIRAADIARFQGIANAGLDVSYRHTTGPPPRVARALAQKSETREAPKVEGRQSRRP